MLEIFFLLGSILTGAMGCKDSSQFHLTRWTRNTTLPGNVVSILLVDMNGKPVPGAVVGHYIEGLDTDQGCKALASYTHGTQIKISPVAEGVLYFHNPNCPPVHISGTDGTITLSQTNLFGYGFIPDWSSNRYEVLSVIHPTRNIGACITLLPADLGSRCLVTLAPLRVLFGKIADADGNAVTDIQTSLMAYVGNRWTPVGGYKSASGRYAYLIPPGDYQLWGIVLGTKEFERFPVSVPTAVSVLHKDFRLLNPLTPIE